MLGYAGGCSFRHREAEALLPAVEARPCSGGPLQPEGTEPSRVPSGVRERYTSRAIQAP